MKPSWIKINLPRGERYLRVREILKKHSLHTVCEEARCPNLGECWGMGTATFMILGDICTRRCRFCAVRTGNPKGKIDREEPERIAIAVKELNLKYVVITSVDRDDLFDGGAEEFAKAVIAIKEKDSKIEVETLIPDFSGDLESLKKVVDAEPDVMGHNLETVERLTPLVRDKRARYRLSLGVLKRIKILNPGIVTKSGIMLGFGEEREEVLKTMEDMRGTGVDILTLGQYLQPTLKHLPVKRYISPEEFDEYKEVGMRMDFKDVLAGPLVRSSYYAERSFSTISAWSDLKYLIPLRLIGD